MTTEEKFEDAERDCLGYPCGVFTCPYCICGRATCGSYCEDHCTKSLFHELTDAKRKMYEEDDDGNRIIVDNPYVYQSEAVMPLEPWVKTQDIIDLNHGLVKLPQQDKKGTNK